MRRKSVYILGLFVLFSSVLYARVNPVMAKASDGAGAAQTNGIEMLWNISMAVNDVAVSKDGNYIAAVNYTGVYYFASNNSNPKWWYLSPSTSLSVAISADGEYVVAGDSSGYIHYFNDSRATTGERTSPTWSSYYLYGSVERGTLDISDDGEYVALGGTGQNMYYYVNCSARSGPDQSATWTDYLEYDVRAVHISPDGKYVAAGGYTSVGGFVAFYKDANIEPYPTEPNWYATSSIDGSIWDLAVSNDGYAVVAVDVTYGTLHYWANATTLSGDPNATWTNDGAFGSVDVSSDGNNVVAGGLSLPSLHFWTNAREREGTQTENWTRLEFAYVLDVAINDDGSLIAAAAMIGVASNYKAYFFESNGGMIGEFDLLQFCPLVSMSGDGRVVAVAGPGYDSLYVFIPEFPPVLAMPLFMLATLLAVILLGKRKHLIVPKERINQ